MASAQLNATARPLPSARAAVVIALLFSTVAVVARPALSGAAAPVVAPGTILPVRLLANPSFELPSLVGTSWWVVNGIGGSGGSAKLPGWQSTHPQVGSVVQPIELWSAGMAAPHSGNKLVELNYTQPSALYQDLCVQSGETVNWSTWHRGRSGTESMKVTIAPPALWGSSVLPPAGVSYDSGALADGLSWGYHAATWTNTSSTGLYRFAYSGISPAGSSGNLIDDSNVVMGVVGEFAPAGVTVNPPTTGATGAFYKTLRLSGTAGSSVTMTLDIAPGSTLTLPEFTVGGVYNGAGTLIPGATATQTASGIVVSVPAGTYNPNDATGYVSVELIPALASYATDRVLNLSMSSMTGGSSATVPSARIGSAACTSALTTSTVKLVMPKFDPAIAKTGPSTITAGSAISYSVVVANNLSEAALPGAITVTDSPPAGLSGSWTCTAVGTTPCPTLGTGNALAATIASGMKTTDKLTFTYTGTTDPAMTSAPLTNSASIGIPATFVDASLANNVSSTTAALTGLPDLTVDKTGTTGVVVSGSTATWQLQVNNIREAAAQNVTVTDGLPVGFTLVSMTPSDPSVTCVLSTRTCSKSTLAGNSSFTVTVVATAAVDVTDGATWTNSASVGATKELRLDNNTDSVSGVYSRQADVSLDKALAGPIVAGANAQYVLTVANAGPGTASAVMVTDEIPAGMTFVPAGSDSRCALAGTTLSCTIGSMAPSSTTTLVLVMTADPDLADGSTVTNNASVTTTTNDTDPSNNADSATGTVARSVDLKVAKSATNNSAVAGGTVSYTIDVSNAGPSDASAVVVSDTLPAELDATSAVVSPSANCSLSGADIVCNFATLPAGQSAQITVTASVLSSVASATNVVNSATVSSPETDSDPSNNTDDASVLVERVTQLEITKTPSTSTVTAGGSFSWTISVRNAGPSDSSAVVLTDTLPTGTTFDSGASDGRCEAIGQAVTCPIGDIGAGQTINVEVFVDVANWLVDGSTLVNQASASSPDAETATATSEVDVQRVADLGIEKSGPATGTAGEAFMWTVKVTNHGPSVVDGAAFTDHLPSGFTLTAASGATCTGTDTVECALGTLDPQQSVEVTLTGTLDPSLAAGLVLTNTATVHSTTTDNNPDNDEASASTTVERSTVLRIEKAAARTVVSLGESAVFQITVVNDGPSDASGIVVTDTLPDGLTFDAGLSDTTCSESGGVVTCEPGIVLAPGAQLTLTITASTDANGETGIVTNTAGATSAENPTGVTDTVDVTLQRTADVDVVKTMRPTNAVAGEAVEWDIVVTNSGPSSARGVTIDDPTPAGVTVTAVTTEQGTCDQTVHCDLGEVGVGTVKITVTGTIAETYVPEGATSAPLSNTVTPGGPDVDPDACTGCTATGTVTASADVVVSKRALNPDAVAGEQTTWELTVANAGPSTAHGVDLHDDLPGGLTFVAAGSDSRCTSADGVAVLCTIGSLAVDQSVTVTVVALVPASMADGAMIVNTVSVTSTTPDPDPGCSACSAQIDVAREADIDAVKTLLDDPLIAGTIARWQVVVTNHGPSNATGVQFTDSLDPALRVDAAGTDPRCTASGQLVTCALGNLAPNASTTVVIATLVGSAIADGTEISNTVTPTSKEVDPNPDCSTCTSGPHTVATSADVELTKSGSSTLVAGTSTSYAISVRNHGPSTARSVMVDDPMVAGLTATSVSSSAGSCSLQAPGIHCDLGDMADEDLVTITVNAFVASSVAADATLTNTAEATSSTTDSNAANNTDSVTGTVTRSNGVVATKLVDQSIVVAGRPVSYTIQATNQGPSDAALITVTDVVPSAIGQLTVTPTTSCSIAGQTVTCNFADVPADASRSVTISGVLAANTPDGSTISNTASITCGSGCTAPTDPSVEFEAIRRADLVLTKSVVTDPVVAGQPVTWRITVENNGPSTADAVLATDQLDSRLTFVTAGSDTRCTADGQLVSCALGNLAPGASETMDLVTMVSPSTDPGAVISNTAATSSDTVDPDPSCAQCSASAGPVGTSADLEVVKTGAAAPQTAGEPTTWTVVVTNHGPSDARDVIATDVLPATLTYVAAGSTASCSASGQTVSCPIGTLAPNASVTLTIVTMLSADAADGSSVTNQITVDTSTPDPDPSCAACSSTIDVVTSADLVTTKTLVTDPIVAGQPVEWTVTVHNNGPSTARDVSVSDPLQSGLTFIAGSSTPECTEATGTVTCAAGDLAVNATSTFTIVALLDPSTPSGTTLANTVTTTSATPDPEPTCTTCTATGTTTRVAHTWINKTGSSTFTAGVPMSWVITVGNDGPSNAGSVTLVDPIPTGFGSVTVDAPTGVTCSVGGLPVAVSCDVGTLTVGQTRQVVIHATPASSYADGGTVANTATIASPDDPDGSHEASLESLVRRATELSLQKTPSVGVVAPGESVDWTLQAGNVGPSDIDLARVVDTIPDGLTITGVTPAAACTIASQTVTCEFPLASHEFRDIVISTTVNSDYADATIVNTATATCATAECDQVDASTTVESRPKADLVLAKSFAGDSLMAGENGTFILTLVNNGPSDAQSVVIGDQLPTGLTFVSDGSDSRCSATGQAVTCTIGTLAADDRETLTLVVAVDPAIEADSVTNAASVTSPTPDPNPLCATCVAGPIPIDRSADIDAEKVLVSPRLIAGLDAQYRITVTNHGPSQATDVVVTDVLPAGFTLDAARSPGCTASGQTVTCLIGAMDPDQVVTLDLIAHIDPTLAAGTPVQNTVEVSSPTPDPNPICTACTTTVTPSERLADLVTTKTFMDTQLVPGTTARWLVTVTNNGPSVASGVVVSDELNAALTFNAGQSDSRCVADGQAVTCTIGDLAVGQSATMVIATDVDPSFAPGDTVTNTVTTTGEEPDPNPVCPDCEAVSPPASPQADLTVDISVPATSVAGETTTIAVTAQNLGPSTAIGSFVSISLPDELFAPDGSHGAIAGSTSAGDCTVSGRMLVCPTGTLLPGTQLSFTFTAAIPDSVANHAVLPFTSTIASDTPEIDSTNNRATGPTEVVRSAGVTITKSVSAAAPLAGTGLRWTITVRNAGPSVAGNVVVTDSLPAGIVSATTDDDRCAVSGQLVTCALDTVAVGGEVVIVVDATVDPSTPGGTDLTNSVAVSCGDDCAGAETSVPATADASADLVVTKTVSGSVAPGGTIEWTLTAKNNGPSTAVAAKLIDVLPAGLSLVSGSLPDGCSEAASTVTCQLGDLLPDATRTIVLKTVLDVAYRGTSVSNSASGETSTPDPAPGCDTCAATIEVDDSAALSITKDPLETEVLEGGPAAWTISVHNDGPATARQVMVHDSLADGLSFASDSLGICAADGQAVSCDVGDLADQQTVTFVLRVSNALPTGSTIANTASVTSPTPEPGGATRPSAESKPISVTGGAVIVVEKRVVGASNVHTGDTVSYTVAATNTGTARATGVELVDTPASGIEVSSLPDGCTNQGADIRCTVGSLGVGETAERKLTFKVTAKPGSEIPNLATAVAALAKVVNRDLAPAPDKVVIRVIDKEPAVLALVANIPVVGSLAHTGTQAWLIVGIGAVLLLAGLALALVGRARRRRTPDDSAH